MTDIKQKTDETMEDVKKKENIKFNDTSIYQLKKGRPEPIIEIDLGNGKRIIGIHSFGELYTGGPICKESHFVDGDGENGFYVTGIEDLLHRFQEIKFIKKDK